jgi:hypothetical protein
MIPRTMALLIVSLAFGAPAAFSPSLRVQLTAAKKGNR